MLYEFYFLRFLTPCYLLLCETNSATGADKKCQFDSVRLVNNDLLLEMSLQRYLSPIGKGHPEEAKQC